MFLCNSYGNESNDDDDDDGNVNAGLAPGGILKQRPRPCD